MKKYNDKKERRMRGEKEVTSRENDHYKPLYVSYNATKV